MRHTRVVKTMRRKRNPKKKTLNIWRELVEDVERLPKRQGLQLRPKDFGETMTLYRLRGLVNRALDTRRWWQHEPKPMTVTMEGGVITVQHADRVLVRFRRKR